MPNSKFRFVIELSVYGLDLPQHCERQMYSLLVNLLVLRSMIGLPSRPTSRSLSGYWPDCGDSSLLWHCVWLAQQSWYCSVRNWRASLVFDDRVWHIETSEKPMNDKSCCEPVVGVTDSTISQDINGSCKLDCHHDLRRNTGFLFDHCDYSGNILQVFPSGFYSDNSVDLPMLRYRSSMATA